MTFYAVKNTVQEAFMSNKINPERFILYNSTFQKPNQDSPSSYGHHSLLVDMLSTGAESAFPIMHHPSKF